jgi:hypothetical protein
MLTTCEVFTEGKPLFAAVASFELGGNIMSNPLWTAAHITNLKVVLISLVIAIAVSAIAINAHFTASSTGNAQVSSMNS